MDTSERIDEQITTSEEFNEALNNLIQTACANDVDVEGGWECRAGPQDPDWDVVILEVINKATPENENGEGDR